MANVNVTYEQMESEASQLVSEKDDIQSKLSALRARIQNLTESGFVTDQASGKFNQMYEQFTQDADRTIEVLTYISNYLNNTANVMRDTDAQLASAINI